MEPSQDCDGDGAIHSMCGGIHSDTTAVCGHHVPGYSCREGIADWKREEFIIKAVEAEAEPGNAASQRVLVNYHAPKGTWLATPL